MFCPRPQLLVVYFMGKLFQTEKFSSCLTSVCLDSSQLSVASLNGLVKLGCPPEDLQSRGEALITAWSSLMLPFYACLDDRVWWCCVGGQHFCCRWQPDVEGSGVENAGFLLGIGLKLVPGLGAVKSSYSSSSTAELCRVGFVPWGGAGH